MYVWKLAESLFHFLSTLDYIEIKSQKEEKKLSTQTGGVSISSLSGSNSLIKTEREKIENDEANRSKFLSFPNTTDSKSILQDTIDFIDTGKERVDW